MPEIPVIPVVDQDKPKQSFKKRVTAPLLRPLTPFARFKRGQQDAHETLQNFNDNKEFASVEDEIKDFVSVLGESVATPQERYQKGVELIESRGGPNYDYNVLKNIVGNRPQTPEESKEREFTSADKIRHKALEALARAQGVKNIGGFNSLVQKLESSMTKTESKYLEFGHEPTPDEKERIMREWRKKGYSVSEYNFRPAYDDDVKYTASFSRQVPENVQRGDIGVVRQLLETCENPAQALSSLEKVGLVITKLNLEPNELGKLKELIKFSGSQGSVNFLDEYAKLPISKYLNISRHGGTYEADALLAVLQYGVEKFTPDFFEKVNVLSRYAHTPVSINSLRTYKDIVNSEDKFTFLTTGLARGYIESYRIKLDDVVNLDHETTSKLNILMQSNVKLGLGYGYDNNILSINTSSLREIIDSQEVKSIIDSPDKQQFLQIVREMTNQKIDVKKVESMYEDKEAIVTAYSVLVSNGLIDLSRGYNRPELALETTLKFLENERVRGAIEDPNFSKFLYQLKKDGIQIKPIDNVNYARHDIFEIYRYRDLIELAGENIFDYARLAAEGDVADGDMRDKLNGYGFLWSNTSLIKELQTLGFGTDKLLDTNWIREVTNMPLMKEGVIPSVNDHKRDEWIIDVLLIPHSLQVKMISEPGYSNLGDTISTKKNFDEGIHRIASVIRENEWMQDEEMVPLVLYVVSSSDELLTTERLELANKVVSIAGKNSVSIVSEYEEFKKMHPDKSIENSVILEYAQKFNHPEVSKNLALRKGHKIFGEFLSIDSYMLTKGITEGSVSKEDMQEVGITKTGEEGLVQLEGIMQNFAFSLTSNEFNSDMLKNKSFSDFFKAYVRFNISSWGRHDSNSFLKTISTYEQIKKGQPEILKTDLPSSGVVEVEKIDRSQPAEQPFTESFLSRYGTLAKNIQCALDVSSQPRAFSTMAKIIDEKRLEVIDSLTQDLNNNDNPKAQQHIQQRIDKLRSVNPSDMKLFQANFADLAQEKAFHDLLMQSVFLYTLKKFPEQQERMTAALAGSPNVDSISSMLDFTEHMTTKEAWQEYFTDKRARKSFQNILDTKEINDGLARLVKSGNETKDVSLVEFTPTRGLLMEFSGHMADACWASKYDSTARQFPNMSTVVMQDVSKDVPKPLGSSILIETTAYDGTDLLVIRGLNPLESYINHVKVPDFYKKYTDYVKRIAEQKGRKAAIVIDKHSGGAATNRPLLFNFLVEQKKDLVQIPVSIDDTTFNGYNISNYTYLL